jgi:glycosyltransferase involved in cell wall biosynthesis
MNKITICVGIKNRTFFLIKCLIRSMNKCKLKENLELSIFDCCSDDVDNIKEKILENWKGILFFKQENVAFTRSYTFNKAVENSNSEFIFLCDADMYLPEDFVEQFYKNVSQDKTWFPICFSLLKNKPLIENESNGWWREYGFGMVAITKKVFYESGCLNNVFSEWGGEDNDLYERVKTKKIREKCFGLFHCWHCSLYNMRTTPKNFRYQVSQLLDINRPKYI